MIKNNISKRISFEGITADLAVVVNLLVYEFIVKDIAMCAEYILWFIGIFQFFALYALFTGGVNQLFESVDKLTILKPFRFIVGLFLFLSIGGFFWLGIPTAAVNTPSAWIAFTINLFVVILGGWIALALTMDRTELNKFDIVVKYAAPSLYLMLSESLLLYSVGHIETAAIIFSVMISYFPIRFLMLVKPPVSNFEIITGFSAFAFFITKIVIFSE